MNNSFYIYSNCKLKIVRLHICTWDIKNAKSKLELGMEIENDAEAQLKVPFQVSILLPFDLLGVEIESLHNKLCNEKYSQYIFNDIIRSSDIIDEDSKRGKVLHFKERGKLAVVPVVWKDPKRGNTLNLEINPSGVEDNLYVRMMIDLNADTMAVVKNGIAKKGYIFDFKVNESRNMPDSLVTKIKSSDLVQIRNVFLFHAVPDTYSVDFYDSNKFKSLRKLECDVFAEYTGIEELKKDEYMILFNKESQKNAYSFYTCFSDEIIGAKQIILAIGANIFCSFLFAFPALRNSWDCSQGWVGQFPWEWILAMLILGGLWLYIRREK